MKPWLAATAIGTCFAFGLTGAQANVVIDPAAGLSGTFIFSALGPVDSINDVPGSTMTVTLATPGTIDVHLKDTGQVGDVFGLTLNGTGVTPTSTIGPGGFTGPFFEAFYDDIPLDSGLNTFGILLTAACCEGGEGLFDVSRVGASSPIPEPATIALFGAGLIGLSRVKRRKDRRG
jgi:hypothetical protein